MNDMNVPYNSEKYFTNLFSINYTNTNKLKGGLPLKKGREEEILSHIKLSGKSDL